MPRNSDVIDVKPQNFLVGGNLGVEQTFTVVINAGQWLGFGGFTYTTAGTVQSSKTR